MIPFLDLKDLFVLFRDAWFASLLLAAASGFLGVHVILRRTVFIGFALSQMAAVGVAFSFMIALSPFAHIVEKLITAEEQRHIVFAALFELIAVAGFTLAGGARKKLSELVLGITYVAAGAASVLLVAAAGSAHGIEEMKTLLQGDILGITSADLRLLLIILLPLLAVNVLVLPRLLFTAFDPETALTLGVRTRLWDLVYFLSLGCLFAVSLKMTGTLFSFAFLILPGGTALLVTRRPWAIFSAAVAFALVADAVGVIAQHQLDLPAAPAASGAAFLMFLAVKGLTVVLGRLRREPRDTIEPAPVPADGAPASRAVREGTRQ